MNNAYLIQVNAVCVPFKPREYIKENIYNIFT